MDKLFYESHSQALQRTRLTKLSNFLESMRTADNSDVILVCNGKEFFAHKLVLQSSGQYFKTMFDSRTTDDEMGKVEVKGMEPNTLNAILKYIYLGEVGKLKTVDEIVKVLSASHKLQLNDLVQYCFHVLKELISVTNYLNLWELGVKYNNSSLNMKIMDFLLVFFNYVISNDFLFTSWSPYQLQSFLLHCKDNWEVVCLDRILSGVLKWLLHDLKERETVSGELLACVDVDKVSRECMTSLLQDNIIMKSSSELTNRMNEMGVAFFLQGNSMTTEQPLLRDKAMWPFSDLTDGSKSTTSSNLHVAQITNCLSRLSANEQSDMFTFSGQNEKDF